MNKNICVIGLGYIGLPTAVIFANNGWKVTGVDVNENIINTISKGEAHIKEPGLDEALQKVIFEKNLILSNKPSEADVYIITVPTPLNKKNKVDLSYLSAAIKSLLLVMKKGAIVIIESTIPPRTTRDIVVPMIESEGFKPGIDVLISHCPERVLPGNIIFEMINNNRIIGGFNEESSLETKKIYETFVKGELIITDCDTAEMAKLMENTYRDVNIALANELTKISINLGINALEVIDLANKHPRVNLHQPGPGVGGHCIAVDPYFIIERDYSNSKLIKQARQINNSMIDFIVGHVREIVDIDSTITILGIAYKGDVDDIRESPAIKIYNDLSDIGYNIKVHDPFVKQKQTELNLVSFDESIIDSELLLILCDHSDFKNISYDDLKIQMKNVKVFDTKNIMKDSNFSEYYNFNNLHAMLE